MPGKVTKVDGYRVRWGGRTTAKSTSKWKARRQLRLLYGVEHGMVPRKRRKKR